MPRSKPEVFESHARMAKAPGRVNLIGEHTDYNGGLVLPIAIDRHICIAFSPIEERRVEIYSLDLDDRQEFWLGEPAGQKPAGWIAYIRGVAWVLEASGYDLTGLVAALGGNVPVGAGLSSSAALEVAAALAFCDSLEKKPSKHDLALICRKAENEFVGVACGIMDQFTSLFAQEGSAILLDCSQLKYEYIRIPKDVDIIVCDTGVRRELTSSEYNKRRQECDQALLTLNRPYRPLHHLSSLALDELPDAERLLPEHLFKRVRHIVTENARVAAMAKALNKADFPAIGELMRQSHESLRDDYQVSSPELDALVEAAAQIDGTIGARMTGAGFGGCTVNLVHRGAVAEFTVKVPELYSRATGRRPSLWPCKPAAGATVIGMEESRE